MPKTPVKTFVRTLADDTRGNIAIIAAVAMPVLLGSAGLGVEVASWYSGKRAMQNAADSAAIAAATNATDSFDEEARAVAARYGYVHGVDGITVTALRNVPCPSGGNNCYSVKIDRLQPVLLAQAVGFQGDGTINGAPAKLISARAVAIQANAPREYCILALAHSGDPEALRTNGAPKSNMAGCNVMSNTNATCNGHDLNAEVGDAVGINNGCGKRRNSNVDKLEDPYADRASNIPPDPCNGTYHRAPEKKKDEKLPSSNLLHGLESRDFIPICGDAELSGPVFINSDSDGTVLVVYNGQLDLGNYTLQTQGDSSLTVIFAGSDNTRAHKPVGDGTFDFKAPTTGPWKGMAIYQDPAINGGVDVKEAGNSPTWKMSGLVYMPKASVTLSGAVNKSSNGASCFGLVVDNLTINGTGSILAQGECAEAGVELPYSFVPARGELVL